MKQALRHAATNVVRVLAGPFTLPIPSGINRGRLWRVKSGVLSCALGTYEHDEATLLGKLIPAGATVYDVGAHAGYYTLAAARLVGPAGRVVAFEPDPQNLDYLRAHIRLNRAANVTIIDRPVGGEHGRTVSFVVNSLRRYESGVRETSGEAMNLVGLDRLIADGMPPPDVLKMDIEGMEVDALAGATGLLKAGKTSWIISVHGDDNGRKVIKILRNAGCDVYDLQDETQPLGPDPKMPIYTVLGVPAGRPFPR